jgi:hypothetical protein
VLARGQLPEQLGALRKGVALKLQEAVDDVLHGSLHRGVGWKSMDEECAGQTIASKTGLLFSR